MKTGTQAQAQMYLKAGSTQGKEMLAEALTMCGFEPIRLSGNYIGVVADNAATETILVALEAVSWSLDAGTVLIMNGNEWAGYTYTGRDYDDAIWCVKRSHNGGGTWQSEGRYRVRYGDPD